MLYSSVMAFVEQDVIVSDLAHTHDRTLLREISASYQQPRVLVENIRAVEQSVPIGCADHQNAGYVTFEQISESYDRWEEYMRLQCQHPDCPRSACIRMNIDGRWTNSAISRIAVSRESTEQVPLGNEKIAAYAGELILVFHRNELHTG